MSTGDNALIREARRVADTPGHDYWAGDAKRCLRRLADVLEAALAVVPAGAPMPPPTVHGVFHACAASHELIKGLTAMLDGSSTVRATPGASPERFGIIAAMRAVVNELARMTAMRDDCVAHAKEADRQLAAITAERDALSRKVDIAVKAYEMLRALDTDIRDEDETPAGGSR